MNANNPMTPGVYTVEKSAFPPSVVGAPTAVPAFIGYTEKAVRNGKSLHLQPLLIQSLAEYNLYFGGAPETKYPIVEVAKNADGSPPAPGTYDFTYGPKYYEVEKASQSNFYLYHCLQWYFLNGGGECYIVSVGNYLAWDAIAKGDLPAAVEKPDLEKGLATLPNVPFPKPTMILMPDLMVLGNEDAYALQIEMLQQCADLQDRMAILDIPSGYQGLESGVIQGFRNNIGVSNLNYGAAYYPWMECDVVDPSEVSYANIDNSGTALKSGSTPIKMTDLFKGNQVVTTLDSLTTDLDTLKEYIEIPWATKFPDLHTWEAAFNSGQGDAKAVLKTQGEVLIDMYQTLYDLGKDGTSSGNSSLKLTNNELIKAIKLLTNPKGSLASLMVTLAGYDEFVGGKGGGAGAKVSAKLTGWQITPPTPIPNPFGTATDPKCRFQYGRAFL